MCIPFEYSWFTNLFHTDSSHSDADRIFHLFGISEHFVHNNVEQQLLTHRFVSSIIVQIFLEQGAYAVSFDYPQVSVSVYLLFLNTELFATISRRGMALFKCNCNWLLL